VGWGREKACESGRERAKRAVDPVRGPAGWAGDLIGRGRPLEIFGKGPQSRFGLIAMGPVGRYGSGPITEGGSFLHRGKDEFAWWWKSAGYRRRLQDFGRQDTGRD